MTTKEMLTPTSLGGLTVGKVGSKTPWINMSIYGESTVGKTILSASACRVLEMSPVIHIDCEGGTLSLVNMYPEVDTVRVKSTGELQDVYSDLHRGNHPYKTAILDSGTEVQQFVMLELLGKAAELDETVVDVFESWKDWHRTLNRMRKIIRGFRDLEMHTIITALATEKQDPKSGLRTMQPRFYGQFLQEFPAIPDVVLYYYVKDIETDDGEISQRVITSKKTERVVAKDRTQMLPEYMVAPTMEQLYPLLNEGFKKLKDKPHDDETVPEPINVEPTNEDEAALNI